MREGASVGVSGVGIEKFCCEVLGKDKGISEILIKAEREEIQQPVVFQSGSEPTSVPVEFISIPSEVNFAVVLALMQLGSGFRMALHRVIGIGASDTMTLGTVALHNECGKTLSADALARLSLEIVAKCFQIPLKKESEDEDDQTLKKLAVMTHKVLVDAGKALQSKGYCDFYELTKKHQTAEGLVGELVEVIPGFCDCVECCGSGIWFCKKAQLCASDLHARFSKRGMFVFPDISTCPVFVDNVLPAVLRAFGVIVVSPELTAKLDAGTLLPAGGSEEVELRACALAACDDIVARAGVVCPGVITSARQLDWLLWVVGKRPDLRKVARHLCQDTYFY